MTAKRISEERVWMKYYHTDFDADPIPKTTAYAYLKASNQDALKRVALNYYGKKITYETLFSKIDECANAFYAMGVRQGDIVSFLSVAIPETIAAIYALNKIGATANTIDPRMDSQSILRMVKESESRFFVVIDVAFAKVVPIMTDIAQEKIIVQSAARSMPFIKKTAFKLVVKVSIPFSESILAWDTFISGGKGTEALEAPYVGDAVMAIAYTGGTTGLAKGVMLTNDSVNCVAYNFKFSGFKHTTGDKFLGIIPVFSSYGMVCGMHMPLCFGLELIPIPKFNPLEFGKLIKKFRPNHMISTPAFYELLMNSKELKGMDLSFITTLGSGGDTMNDGLERKLHEWMKQTHMPYPLAQGYGMSELSAAASFCINDIYKAGSVGIPSVTTIVSVFDPETGEELGYNTEGEICVTGPSMMKGYFKRPEETAHVMRKHDDGRLWIHSGDIGYIDEDGFLFIKGRLKRMITRFDGHKVFPINIESMVSERKDVLNCSVIGVADRGHGQGHYPMVLVEFAPGVDKEAMAKEIFDECEARLEERGRPVAVLPIDSIPLTGMGKNDYRALEEIYRHYDYTAE